MRRHSGVCMLVILFLTVPHSLLLAQVSEPQEQEEQKQPQEPQEAQGTKTPPPEKPDQIVRPSETASTPSTGRKIITNFWHDQKAMWTSPFHVNKSDAKWWALFAGSTAV